MKFINSFLFIYTALCVILCYGECEVQNTNQIQKFTDLSPREKAVIEKVKELAGDGLYRDYMKTDKYLVRWVRDANLDPKIATERILKFHEYRKINDIDSILTRKWSEMERKFPFEIIDGLDNEGGAVALLSVGKWDIRKEVLSGGTQRFRSYIDYALEKCDVVIRETKPINGTAILNMSGYSLKTTACLACIPQILYFVNTLEHHYPQILKHFYMVNTPNYFNPLLRIIVPLLSPHTNRIYRVYGYDKTDWAPIVLSKIPAHLLPGEFGGTRKY